MSTEEPTDFVTLVSNDGFEYKVLRSAAGISGVMKRMLDPNSKISHYCPNEVALIHSHLSHIFVRAIQNSRLYTRVAVVAMMV